MMLPARLVRCFLQEPFLLRSFHWLVFLREKEYRVDICLTGQACACCSSKWILLESDSEKNDIDMHYLCIYNGFLNTRADWKSIFLDKHDCYSWIWCSTRVSGIEKCQNHIQCFINVGNYFFHIRLYQKNITYRVSRSKWWESWSISIR